MRPDYRRARHSRRTNRHCVTYFEGSMNAVVIPIRSVAPGASRPSRPKARQVTPQALAAVESAIGTLPLRRDLLIEQLHAINDRYGQLRTDHLAALAQLLRLSQAEVYEVASFYHHFEVVRESADGTFQKPPTLTVRVCEGLSCEMAGAADLLR